MGKPHLALFNNVTQLRNQRRNIPARLPQRISFLRATYTITRKQLMGQQTLVCHLIPSHARLTGHRKTAGEISYSVIRRFPLLGVWDPCQNDVAIFSMRYKIHRAEPNKSLSGDKDELHYVSGESQAAKEK